MSEKFCLKWNDFQSMVTQSFSVLRQEQDFYDVTLVSEDETQIPAHFFKSILKKNTHSHPLLYLSGVDSKSLGFVLDYIYQGEVQIYQEELENFLDVAQKLKIEGLLSTEDPSDDNKDEVFQYRKPKSEIPNIPAEPSEVQVYKEDPVVRNMEYKKAITINDMSEADDTIQQLMEKRDGRHFCTVCDYSSLQKIHLKEHVELHIEGLYYPCNFCGKTFRSKNSFRRHRCMNN